MTERAQEQPIPSFAEFVSYWEDSNPTCEFVSLIWSNIMIARRNIELSG